jgi:hypothetical protein
VSPYGTKYRQYRNPRKIGKSAERVAAEVPKEVATHSLSEIRSELAGWW